MTETVRMATHGPTLLWARTIDVAEEPPMLKTLEGQEIRWDDWEIAPELSHVESECEQCGYDGQPWLTFGAIHVAPRRLVKVLFVRRCPACEADVIYDLRHDRRCDRDLCHPDCPLRQQATEDDEPYPGKAKEAK